MQSVLSLSSPPVIPSNLMGYQPMLVLGGSVLSSSRFTSIRSNAQAVNYSSTVSVFPAEACETIGGDTCQADMYPEVKLQPQPDADKPKASTSEAVEREYLDYTDPRTVLLGEACDVLGGDFCEQPFQNGIC